MDLPKRAADFFIAGLVLTLLSPALAILASLVLATMGRPVIFRQRRTGLRDAEFTIYKLRTMTGARNADGFSLPDSQRLTRVGRFLRTTSLDEVPQLWNVIRGEMSLVGPRPLLPAYIPRYTDFQRRRHEVKPGITGWAQVNGRNSLSWEEKFELDVWYVENRSFLVDMRVLWLTVVNVFRRTGISTEGSATAPEFMGSTHSTTAGRGPQ